MARPPLHGQPMTPAQRKAKQRTTRLILLESARANLRVLLAMLDPGHQAEEYDLVVDIMADLADIK